MQRNNRRDARYRVIPHSELSTCRILSADGEIESAELLDLSRGGARLSSAHQFAVGDEFQISLNLADGGMRLSVTVCWVAVDLQREWIVGCSFRSRLGPHVLEDLAERKQVERRQDERHNVSMVTKAMTPQTETFTAIRLVNISQGGFCAAASVASPVLVGDPIVLTHRRLFRYSRFVRGQVHWVRQEGDETVFGCSFATKQDSAQLHDIVAEESAFEIDPEASEPSWSLVVVAVTLVVLLSLV